MTPDRWRRAQEIFLAATERKQSLRPAFLDEACRNDPDLRSDVESLLSSYRAAPSSFLESPAIGARPDLPPPSGPPRSLGKGTQLGPYEILASLGSGVMGEVYRARDPRLGREVAIKVMPAEWSSDPSRVKRFEQEARAASALNHPNIVSVYDTGSSNAVAWIAMERVEGSTLRELFNGPLATKRLLAIATQVADGLAKAHEAGIVHRDLKPENVMVTKDGLVKILDFGLAKLTSTGSGSGEDSKLPTMTGTTPGVIVGTVGYMSPEQASGERIDFRSDQFSFGSILYEMATGRRAFQKKNPIDTLGAILNEEPEPIVATHPRTPAQLRWMVERCLAKDPRQRYSSTDDLARDLATLRDHLSDVPSGDATIRPGPLRLRRGAISAIVGLALVAAAFAGWGIERRFPEAPAAPTFKRLTFRKGLVGNARFAPDGQTVVYDATWQGEPHQLYLTRTDSPESKPFEFLGTIQSISHSGEMAIVQKDNTLATVSMAGGVPRPLVENVLNGEGSADWTPDGKRLLVVRDVDGERRLEFPVGTVLASGVVLSARFSPDGKAIAFFKYFPTENNRTAVAIVETGGQPERILAGGFFGWNGVPCWAPGGSEVWFTAPRGNNSQTLWAVDLAGKLRLVTRVPGDLELDDISQNGRMLMSHIAMLWSVRGLGPGQTKERDLSWMNEGYASDLSADGTTLILSENSQGVGETPAAAVYLRGTDGSPAVRLGDGFAVALSPDKKWVLANVDQGAGKPSRRVLLPTGPGETKDLAKDGLSPGMNPGGYGAFTPDGKRIVFGAPGLDGKNRLYVQEIPNGKPRAISGEDVNIQAFTNPVSADGRFVVGVSGRQHGQPPMLYPIDGGGPPRAIPGVVAGDHVIQWTADSRSLYVHKFQARTIWLLDVATGQKRLWKELPLDDWFYRLIVRITPDGKSYVYHGVNILSDLYLVEGLR